MDVASSLLQTGRLGLPDACRTIRAIHSVSQVEFARRIGVNRKVVKDLECGRGNPGLESLARIAQAAGLRLAFVPEQNAVGRLDAAERSREEDARRRADAASLQRGLSPEALYRRNALGLGGITLRLPRIA